MDASPIGASVFALNVSGLRLTFGAFFVYAGFNPYVVIMASLESKELNGQRPVLDGSYVFKGKVGNAGLVMSLKGRLASQWTRVFKFNDKAALFALTCLQDFRFVGFTLQSLEPEFFTERSKIWMISSGRNSDLVDCPRDQFFQV